MGVVPSPTLPPQVHSPTILISKKFLQRDNGLLPTTSRRNKSSTLSTIFSSKYQTEQTPLVTIIPPFAHTEGYINLSQQCHRKFTSDVNRSLLMSPRFLMLIHSQSVAQVRRIEAC